MSVPAVAVVGVGHMGGLHAEKLAELAREGIARLAGVCDLDAGRARQVAERHDVPVLADLAAVTQAADAVCLAAPTSDHARLARELIVAGLDVLVEKPLATTREDALGLIEAARLGGCILQVGHIERYSRALEAIRPILRAPRFVEVHRLGPYPGRATDVGVVLDLMIHDLDIVSHLVAVPVDRVEAIGVPVLSQTEDIANARLTFANGCVLNITASRVSLERMRKIRMFQSDAYISIDLANDDITVVTREGQPGGESPAEIKAETLEFDAADALLAQDRDFVRAVAERGQPLVTGEDGLRALDLALRVLDSMPPLHELER